MALGHHSHCSELSEVLIEAECRRQSKLLDDDLARAIGEAPFFVSIGAEDLPRLTDFFLAHEMQIRPMSDEQLIAQGHGTRGLVSGSEQRQGFVENKIRRDERIAILIHPRGGCGVVRVPRHNASEPGSGVNEDHRAPCFP